MNLNVRDVSRLLNVSEKTVYKWLGEGTIPAYKIQDQYRFNRAEILEWATSRKMSVSPSAFDDTVPDAGMAGDITLSGSLRRGGVHYKVGGENKVSVLRNVVGVLPLPEGVDREFLAEMVLARENMGSTAVGNGIAIPHPRFPVVLPPTPESLSLCFLETPVDFSAIDGKPVGVLFVLISSTVNNHLKLLSKLAFALQDGEVTKCLAANEAPDAIFSVFAAADERIGGGKER